MVSKSGQIAAVLLCVGMLAGCTGAVPTGSAGQASPPAASGPASTAAPLPSPSASLSDAAQIPGVVLFRNEAAHVKGPVVYAQIPPVGGAHSATWLNCGIYTEAVPNENAVHDLEHGAVWVTYDPTLAASEVEKLRELLPPTHTLISPYSGMSSPIVISAWNAQLMVTTASDPRLAQFITQYRNSATAPEPGAPCTGGLDAPGRLRSSTA